MILVAQRGESFSEPFNFKDGQGKPVAAPAGDYKLTLERGSFVREYTDLPVQRAGVVWTLTGQEVESLPYGTLYFTLTYNGGEITRGVLRVN